MRAARAGRGVRLDVGEPGLDFGDAAGVVTPSPASASNSPALDVGVEHEADERLRAARRLLLDRADARVARHLNRTSFGRKLAANDAEQRRFARAVAADEASPRASRRTGVLCAAPSRPLLVLAP